MSKKPPQIAAPVAETDSPELVPMEVPEGGWPADEFTGQAGDFVRDPYTGKRSRVPAPTAPTPDAQA